jgi:hypothetical protein
LGRRYAPPYWTPSCRPADPPTWFASPTKNPAVFCALLGKILPTEIADDEPITHEVVLKWMTPEMAKARGLVGPAEKRTS